MNTASKQKSRSWVVLVIGANELPHEASRIVNGKHTGPFYSPGGRIYDVPERRAHYYAFAAYSTAEGFPCTVEFEVR